MRNNNNNNNDELLEIEFADGGGGEADAPDYDTPAVGEDTDSRSPQERTASFDGPESEEGASGRSSGPANRRTQARRAQADDDGEAADIDADMSLEDEREDIRPVEDEGPPPEQPEFDWLTEIAIPLSIFGMLGAFLYFLIDLYQVVGGDFSSGLRWVCFWFLLATIGITRIRTKYGSNTIAAPYSIGLGIAVGLFVVRLTMTSGAFLESLSSAGLLLSLLFNIALVVLIWWIADKVTRECTLEENVEYSLSEGFMTGLAGDEEKAAVRGADEKEAETARHPGRIVLWVAVAAVVAFGLGTLRMGDDTTFATHAFWCMGAFVFFALVLLAMTNLSAIRMNIRQRGVRITKSLVPTWIAASLGLVLLIVIASALFPRPGGREAQRIAAGPKAGWLDEPGRGVTNRLPASGISKERSVVSGEPGRNERVEARGGGGEGGGGGEEAEGGGDEQGAGGGAAGAEGGGGGQGRSGSAGGAGGGSAAGQQGGSSQETPSTSTARPQFSWWWLLLLLLLLALLIYLAIRYRRQIAAFFRRYIMAPLRRMWAAIIAFFERLRKMLGFGGEGEDEFADLPEDPFADIWQQRHLIANMTPAQIVRHVYRAFLGLCSLRGYPRPDHQTEMEFLRTVPARIGLNPDDQKRLTNLYIYAIYSPNEITPALAEQVREIWERMQPSIEEALAAREQDTERQMASGGRRRVARSRE